MARGGVDAVHEVVQRIQSFGGQDAAVVLLRRLLLLLCGGGGRHGSFGLRCGGGWGRPIYLLYVIM